MELCTIHQVPIPSALLNNSSYLTSAQYGDSSGRVGFLEVLDEESTEYSLA